MRHGTYKAFKIIINTIPGREWLTWGLLVKPIPGHFKNTNPRIITKIPQEPTESVFICKVRDLALNYNTQRIDTLLQFVFSDCENDALINSADALGS